jgi:hypothetical protein
MYQAQVDPPHLPIALQMKDVEHYHQFLIDIKEQYQRDVEEFAKMTQLALNKM